jgi:hypothetical protein
VRVREVGDERWEVRGEWRGLLAEVGGEGCGVRLRGERWD